ncbi:MAG: hypothetical protein Q4A74_07630 [Cardiobacteriaceae bacterium]|nr:hypothetical protein [Cardiobacteriaceae bacterium]
MNAQKITLISILGLLSAITSHAISAPPDSITNKGSATQKSASITNMNQKTANEKIRINGLQGGRVINSGNKLIIQGGTIVAEQNQTNPMIQIENPQNKEIIIENTQVIANKVRQSNKNGSAGIIVVENGKKQGNTKSHIQMQNVHVKAVNSTVTAKATGGEKVCAGIVCTGFDDDDKVTGNIIVDVRGNNTFEAESKK